jgi:hypothetical protein
MQFHERMVVANATILPTTWAKSAAVVCPENQGRRASARKKPMANRIGTSRIR